VVTALPVVEDDPAQPAKDRITIHQLKKKLDAKEEIIILDVRSRTAYLGSTVKIKGAVRMLPEQIEERRHELPKDKEIIIYCT
jgi:rhodanese-related sulfurtransferase